MTDNPHLTVALSAHDMDSLQEGILAITRVLPDTDLIAAIRTGDTAHSGDPDIAPRPVDPRPLH